MAVMPDNEYSNYYTTCSLLGSGSDSAHSNYTFDGSKSNECNNTKLYEILIVLRREVNHSTSRTYVVVKSSGRYHIGTHQRTTLEFSTNRTTFSHLTLKGNCIAHYGLTIGLLAVTLH